MAACAVAVQQADGSYLLALQPSVTDVSACAYVVHTGVEEAQGSLLSLTSDQAQVYGVAVFGLWAVAWSAKQAIRVLRGSDEKLD